MGPILPLNLLHNGQFGEIIDIFGDDRLIAQAAEKGLRAGAKLEMLSSGNPFLVRVDGTRLSFRADELMEVMVRIDGN